MNRTEYTVNVETVKEPWLSLPDALLASHHVYYPGETVTNSNKYGTMSFTEPSWAGTAVKHVDGTITAFLPVQGGSNKNLGTFRTIQDAIETVIDFSLAYRAVGIRLWV